MASAFQSNAFEVNAFQIEGVTTNLPVAILGLGAFLQVEDRRPPKVIIPIRAAIAALGPLPRIMMRGVLLDPYAADGRLLAARPTVEARGMVRDIEGEIFALGEEDLHWGRSAD